MSSTEPSAWRWRRPCHLSCLTWAVRPPQSRQLGGDGVHVGSPHLVRLQVEVERRVERHEADVGRREHEREDDAARVELSRELRPQRRQVVAGRHLDAGGRQDVVVDAVHTPAATHRDTYTHTTRHTTRPAHDRRPTWSNVISESNAISEARYWSVQVSIRYTDKW